MTAVQCSGINSTNKKRCLRKILPPSLLKGKRGKKADNATNNANGNVLGEEIKLYCVVHLHQQNDSKSSTSSSSSSSSSSSTTKKFTTGSLTRPAKLKRKYRDDGGIGISRGEESKEEKKREVIIVDDNDNNDDVNSDFVPFVDRKVEVKMQDTVPEMKSETAILPDDKLFECGCCCCESELQEKVNCTEGHVFCKSCLKRWIEERTAGGSARISCMSSVGGNTGSGCKGFFVPSTIALVLSEQALTTWNHRVTQDELGAAKIVGLVTCPRCKLFAAIIEDRDYPHFKDLLECQNSECKYQSCLRCAQAYHGITPMSTSAPHQLVLPRVPIFDGHNLQAIRDAAADQQNALAEWEMQTIRHKENKVENLRSCSQAAHELFLKESKDEELKELEEAKNGSISSSSSSNRLNRIRRTIEELLSSSRIRHCPCGTEFVRTDGCNKCVCTKCERYSCYLCQKEIKGYEHYYDYPHPQAAAPVPMHPPPPFLLAGGVGMDEVPFPLARRVLAPAPAPIPVPNPLLNQPVNLFGWGGWGQAQRAGRLEIADPFAAPPPLPPFVALGAPPVAPIPAAPVGITDLRNRYPGQCPLYTSEEKVEIMAVKSAIKAALAKYESASLTDLLEVSKLLIKLNPTLKTYVDFIFHDVIDFAQAIELSLEQK